MPERIIHGDAGKYELINMFRVGDRDGSTTSTSYEQPYSNRYSSVIPRTLINDTLGYRGTFVSLAGRVNTSSDSASPSIVVSYGSGDRLMETEYVGPSGASFELFHTDKAEWPVDDGGDFIAFIDYHLKSSNGDEVEAFGDIYAAIWGKM